MIKNSKAMWMTKRFTYDSKTVSILKNGEIWLDGSIDTACNHGEICDLLNELTEDKNDLITALQLAIDKNEQLKQQLNDIILNYTQNHIEFDKDKLYIKDNHTEITLKNRNLFISVFIPKTKETLRFNYIVTGRRLEKEYNTFKGDVE